MIAEFAILCLYLVNSGKLQSHQIYSICEQFVTILSPKIRQLACRVLRSHLAEQYNIRRNCRQGQKKHLLLLLPCKAKISYLFTLQTSIYCLSRLSRAVYTHFWNYITVKFLDIHNKKHDFFYKSRIMLKCAINYTVILSTCMYLEIFLSLRNTNSMVYYVMPFVCTKIDFVPLR